MLTSAVITGLGLGSMYGLLALGFHVTYAVSNTVNFAQGGTMMMGAVLSFVLSVTAGWPLLAAAAHPRAARALWSGLRERGAGRPLVWRCSNSRLIATVGLRLALAHVTRFAFV